MLEDTHIPEGLWVLPQRVQSHSLPTPLPLTFNIRASKSVIQYRGEVEGGEVNGEDKKDGGEQPAEGLE